MQLLLSAFQSVPDPRARNRQHDLVELLVLAFVAVLCGAAGCCDMEAFGLTKLKFFKRFLKLKHGIPSHDTFSTVLRIIDPKALDAALGALTTRLVEALAEGGVIAIDGKSLKGAYDKGQEYMPRMMVTAYAANLRLTLASLEAKGGSEVETALSLIGLIDLKGHIVTADALHCHRRMAEAILAKGGDYCLTQGQPQGAYGGCPGASVEDRQEACDGQVRDPRAWPRREARRHRGEGAGRRGAPRFSRLEGVRTHRGDEDRRRQRRS